MNPIQKFKYFISSLKLKRKLSKENIILFNDAIVQMHPTSKIIIEKGNFYFNKPWTEIDPFPSLLSLRENSKIIVEDNFIIYSGARVYINQDAILKLGSGYINNNLNIDCFLKIEIGHNVAISNNVCIRDSDNHLIVSTTHQMMQPIKIGNNVWIGMNVTILKGVEIGDGAIIAAGAVVNKNIPSRCLAAGVPARVIKENVQWY